MLSHDEQPAEDPEKYRRDRQQRPAEPAVTEDLMAEHGRCAAALPHDEDQAQHHTRNQQGQRQA